jgi:hypothetical protein
MECECGCGQTTRIAERTRASLGWVKGEPLRFVNHHNKKARGPAYVVEDRGYTTPCHIWQHSVNNKGYGRVVIDCKERLAHVDAWERVNGPVPTGLELDHLCLVKPCVNPDHLEAVTHRENMRRYRERGRV